MIVAHNTFGLSSDLERLVAIARERNLTVVDDCAHGFGGSYRGRPDGAFADASFFSTQWSKFYSTGLGGIAVANHRHLAEQLRAIEATARVPSLREVVLLRSLLAARDRLLTPTSYWLGVSAYRALSVRNLVPGSSSGGELEAPRLEPGFLKAMSGMQAKRGLDELRHLGANIAHRARVATIYDDLLEELGGSRQTVPAYATDGYLRYPIL